MRRTAQREQTRQHLFETAIRLFRTQGFEATRIESIIAAAHVAKGTFYVHFPTKDAVLAAYADAVAADLAPHVPDWLRRSPPTAIAAIFEALNEYVERDRSFIWHVVRVELVGEPWDDGRPSALAALFQPVVARGQTEGSFRRDLPADALVQHLLSNYLMGLAWILRHQWPLRATMRQVLTLTLDGLHSPGPDPSGSPPQPSASPS